MPIERCNQDGRPGWRWGKTGKCYTYDPESKSAETKARKKAEDQGMAIGEYFGEMLNRMRKVNKKSTDHTFSEECSEECGCGSNHQEFGYNKYPPVHPNCVCEIVAGYWWLGTSKSGPCKACVARSKEYNGFSKLLFKNTKLGGMGRNE